MGIERNEWQIKKRWKKGSEFWNWIWYKTQNPPKARHKIHQKEGASSRKMKVIQLENEPLLPTPYRIKRVIVLEGQLLERQLQKNIKDKMLSRNKH